MEAISAQVAIGHPQTRVYWTYFTLWLYIGLKGFAWMRWLYFAEWSSMNITYTLTVHRTEMSRIDKVAVWSSMNIFYTFIVHRVERCPRNAIKPPERQSVLTLPCWLVIHERTNQLLGSYTARWICIPRPLYFIRGCVYICYGIPMQHVKIHALKLIGFVPTTLKNSVL